MYSFVSLSNHKNTLISIPCTILYPYWKNILHIGNFANPSAQQLLLNVKSNVFQLITVCVTFYVSTGDHCIIAEKTQSALHSMHVQLRDMYPINVNRKL